MSPDVKKQLAVIEAKEKEEEMRRKKLKEEELLRVMPRVLF
jgi:phage anti-repressor protein